ncbi:hypothetical protein [Deinococcus ficus]|uniref:hypothetical protein n=1 Tax=Deinococcus ficus TaxID=317577 RepID=UPI00174A89E2|nr:hypothetical protein [Deinococcus ficus]GHF75620.1 hypothetical protein GCM10017782_11660 [Deinococcus ficus]
MNLLARAASERLNNMKRTVPLLLAVLLAGSTGAYAQRVATAAVVLTDYRCSSWAIAEGITGYYLIEWFGGKPILKGDVFSGEINKFGFATVKHRGGQTSRVWVDDFMLSKSRALTKFASKCRI